MKKSLITTIMGLAVVVSHADESCTFYNTRDNSFYRVTGRTIIISDSDLKNSDLLIECKSLPVESSNVLGD